MFDIYTNNVILIWDLVCRGARRQKKTPVWIGLLLVASWLGIKVASMKGSDVQKQA